MPLKSSSIRKWQQFLQIVHAVLVTLRKAEIKPDITNLFSKKKVPEKWATLKCKSICKISHKTQFPETEVLTYTIVIEVRNANNRALFSQDYQQK